MVWEFADRGFTETFLYWRRSHVNYNGGYCLPRSGKEQAFLHWTILDFSIWGTRSSYPCSLQTDTVSEISATTPVPKSETYRHATLSLTRQSTKIEQEQTSPLAVKSPTKGKINYIPRCIINKILLNIFKNKYWTQATENIHKRSGKNGKDTGKVREFCHWKKVGTLHWEHPDSPTFLVNYTDIFCCFVLQ